VGFLMCFWLGAVQAAVQAHKVAVAVAVAVSLEYKQSKPSTLLLQHMQSMSLLAVQPKALV
jgi:hypothetical protein